MNAKSCLPAARETRPHRGLCARQGAVVAAREREPLDLILMGVQIPNVDGLEATVIIRDREPGTGGTSLSSR